MKRRTRGPGFPAPRAPAPPRGGGGAAGGSNSGPRRNRIATRLGRPRGRRLPGLRSPSAGSARFADSAEHVLALGARLALAEDADSPRARQVRPQVGRRSILRCSSGPSRRRLRSGLPRASSRRPATTAGSPTSSRPSAASSRPSGKRMIFPRAARASLPPPSPGSRSALPPGLLLDGSSDGGPRPRPLAGGALLASPSPPPDGHPRCKVSRYLGLTAPTADAELPARRPPTSARIDPRAVLRLGPLLASPRRPTRRSLCGDLCRSRRSAGRQA